LSGRHEPSSPATFWISLSTAVLRAGLVVAAVVLGIFVLSKAFPSADEEPPQVAETAAPEETETEEAETPDGGDGGKGTQAPATPDVQGVEVAVLNGAGITDLAACVADEVVRPLGFRVNEADIGNADSEYEVTTIFFTKKVKDAAEYLRSEGFPDAQLRSASSEAFANLSVALGPDAAKGPCASPA
jgi:LytR cell envelope-related transcriptional attenuator